MKLKRGLIYWSFFFLCLMGMSLGWLSCSAGSEENIREYNILVLQSFREDAPWREELEKGIADSFRDAGMHADLSMIYLDSETLSRTEQLEKIEKHIEEYSTPDLVILCNDPAIRTFLSSNHPQTYVLPIVFNGADYWEDRLLKGRQNVTGFTTEPDYVKTVALIKTFFPDMKGLALDVDDSDLSERATEVFMQQVKEFALDKDVDIQVNNLDQSLGSTFMWSATFVNQYPRIMPVWSRFYASRARNTEVPFFSVDNKGLGQGYLGGYIIMAYDQAYQAAERGIEILKGKDISQLPITASVKKPVFDWLQLKKTGIGRDKLPVDSVLINQSLFEQYGDRYVFMVVGGILTFLLISAIVFYLYRKARKAKQKTQEELEGHRTRLKIVMSSIREGVVSVDRNMNIFTVNPAALYWLQLGGEESQYKGKNILSVMDLAGDRNLLKDMIRQVFDTNEAIDFGMIQILSKANNHSSPVVGSISPIHLGNELYGAVIVFHDVTEELAQKEFLELTLSVGDVASWRMDHAQKVVLFDPSFFALNGLEDTGNYSLTLDQLAAMIHPDDLPHWRKVNEVLMAGSMDTFLFEMRVDVNGKGYQWWELRYTALRLYSENDVPHIFGLVRNIEKEKNRLADIEKAREKAELSDRLKSAFLANMSHEIRTPLNAIVGFSNVLTSEEELGPEERQIFIETIRNNCNLLLGLISDVLDIAQIEAGSMLFKEEVCNVNELINQILVTQRVIVPAHIALVGDIPEETSFIITDKLRLNQVITNLINNAVKFTEKGSVTVGYTREDDNFLHFFVEDTGKGIPEADLFNIFERFFKKDDFKQGAGLGLSICKMIVDRFKGEINVASKVGVGSRFTVTIPYIPAISSGLADNKSVFTNSNIYKLYNMNTVAQDAPMQGKVTLLIAEDEESNYLLLKTILQKHCNLIRAKTGKEAIEKFKENEVDLILLDIKMPEMTGIEALKEIRNLNTEIPIIMQSAYVFDSDMEGARQAGASDFITKPINLKILKETLMKYLPSLKF